MAIEKIYCVWESSFLEHNARLSDRILPELNSIDWKLATGVRVDEFPEDVTFDLSTNWGMELTDYIGNIFGFHVVSERLKDAIVDSGERDIQYHPIRIRNHKKRIVSDPYYIMNPIGAVDCMDQQKSDYDEAPLSPGQALTIRRLALDIAKIPDDRKLFRLGTEKGLVLVRKDLAFDIYRTRGYRGMVFTKLELYGEEFRDPGSRA